MESMKNKKKPEHIHTPAENNTTNFTLQDYTCKVSPLYSTLAV
jgi:hypothetical protein